MYENQGCYIDYNSTKDKLKYLKRRSKNEPIAYILKEKEFWKTKFDVNKYTLIPRPETEILVEKLLEFYKGKKKIKNSIENYTDATAS